MPTNETETQETIETSGQEHDEAPSPGETQEAPAQEDQSQEQEPAGDNGPDDQPVTAPAKPGSETSGWTPERYDRYIGEMQNHIKVLTETVRRREEADAVAKAAANKPTPGKYLDHMRGRYADDQVDAFKTAFEGLKQEMYEELGVDKLRQQVEWLAPYAAKAALSVEETEAQQKIAGELSIPMTEMPALKQAVDKMVNQDGIRAPYSVLYRAAYADRAAAASKKLATETKQAREAKRTQAPVTPQHRPATNPSFKPPADIPVSDLVAMSDWIMKNGPR